MTSFDQHTTDGLDGSQTSLGHDACENKGSLGEIATDHPHDTVVVHNLMIFEPVPSE